MVTEDHIPRLVQVFSGGWAHEIIVEGYAESELVGRYMAAVGEFLRTNDASNLWPFEGEWVSDISGNPYLFETRPNILYRLHASGVEPFHEIYRILG